MLVVHALTPAVNGITARNSRGSGTLIVSQNGRPYVFPDETHGVPLIPKMAYSMFEGALTNSSAKVLLPSVGAPPLVVATMLGQNSQGATVQD